MTIAAQAGLVETPQAEVKPAPTPPPPEAAAPKATPRAIALAHFAHIYRQIGDPEAEQNAVELAEAIFGPSQD